MSYSFPSRRRSRRGRLLAPSQPSRCDLPGDLLRAVASRLLVADIVILSAVCKSWRSAIGPLHSEHSSLPLLLTVDYNLEKDSSHFSFFSPWSGETYEVDAPVPGLSGMKLLCCKDDWVLLGRDDFSMFMMLNPFNGSKIEIPRCSIHPWFDLRVASLSGTPSSSSNWAVVLLVQVCRFGRICVATWRAGGKHWKKKNVGTGEIAQGDDFFVPVVFLNGLFYYLLVQEGIHGSGRGNLATFDPETMTWSVLSDPILMIRTQHRGYCHLSEFCGELYYYYVTSIQYRNSRIRIFKLDKRKRMWKEVGDIGRKTMIFLNYRRADLMLESSIAGTGNKIYTNMISMPISSKISTTTMARLSDMLFFKSLLRLGEATREEIASPCFAKERQKFYEDSSQTYKSCGVYYSFEDHDYHPFIKSSLQWRYLKSVWIIPHFSRT